MIVTITTRAEDGSGQYDSVMEFSNPSLYAGNVSKLDRPAGSWIPFVVNIPRGAMISNAVLKLTGSESIGYDGQKILVGIHNSVNSVQPTSGAVLQGYTFLQSYSFNQGVVAGTLYTWDVTSAVQTLINNANWVSGNVIAAMVKDNGCPPDVDVLFAAYENETYQAGRLEIEYSVPFMVSFQCRVVGL